MRFAVLALLGCLATGCSVPEVTFVDDGDAELGSDAGRDAPVAEASAPDAPAADAADGAASYCIGPDASPPPNGLACCPGGTGEACAGQCTAKACTACGTCTWPSVCCTNGGNGTCKPFC